MGLEIDRASFGDDDYADFAARLRDDVAALRVLLARPDFGAGPQTFGAEVEFSLVGDDGRALPINRRVLLESLDPRLCPELDRFNLEYNATPVALAGRPFSTLRAELQSALEQIGVVAARHGARIALTGILPTLQEDDLGAGAITDLMRYRALSAGLRRLRSASFRIDVSGDEHLALECDDVTMEGANTSCQVHLRVAPADFAATFNAAQMAAAPVLAAATNSPIFLSRLLWRETRVALFGQAVDYRMEGPGWRPSRVSFGHGWVRDGAAELFAESVALHSPLLPVVSEEDPLAVLKAGGIPELGELRLHHGTVWSWNRAIYDPSDGGHLRIEMRCLPAGPTCVDMTANAAFLIGLTLGLMPDMPRLLPAMPFRLAHDNFYRAAQHGLDAILLWPSVEPPSPLALRAPDLIERLLPVAQTGLVAAGVAQGEAEEFLGVIAERVRRGRTGACWQRASLRAHERRTGRPQALAAMFEEYLNNAATRRPVSEWACDER